MKIKTFPLQFTEQELEGIRESAAKAHMAMKYYILQAIKEKQEKEK